jgi:hypothetical protein
MPTESFRPGPICQVCEESRALSDRDVADDTGRIEFKQSPEWISAFHEVKQVLSRREHLPTKDETVA